MRLTWNELARLIDRMEDEQREKPVLCVVKGELFYETIADRWVTFDAGLEPDILDEFDFVLKPTNLLARL